MENFFGWAHPSFDLVLTHLRKLGIAYLLALPIGWNRERETRSAGLRMFPLVSVATCAYMLVGMEVLSSTDAEARAMWGIVTAMGFIGGGAILKSAKVGQRYRDGGEPVETGRRRPRHRPGAHRDCAVTVRS